MSRPARRGLDLTSLKMMIVAGSMLATIIGAEQIATASDFTDSQTEFVQAEPQVQTVTVQGTDGQVQTIELAPVPQLEIPEVVTRSRSSK